MEFKYCFGYFTDGELTELMIALLAGFDILTCGKVTGEIHSCEECQHGRACGFLYDAIMIINDEKNRRSDLHD